MRWKLNGISVAGRESSGESYSAFKELSSSCHLWLQGKHSAQSPC